MQRVINMDKLELFQLIALGTCAPPFPPLHDLDVDLSVVRIPQASYAHVASASAPHRYQTYLDRGMRVFDAAGTKVVAPNTTTRDKIVAGHVERL